MTAVVHLVQHLRRGGLETLVLDLTVHAPHARDLYIVSLEGDQAELIRDWPKLGMVHERIFSLGKPPGVHPGTVFSLAKLLRRLKAGVVHTHHIGPLLYGGLAARLAGGIPVVHTEHDAWHLNEAKERRLQRIAMKIARPVLVADASEVARMVTSHFPAERPRVIWNGIDTARFKPGDKLAARVHLGLPQDVVLIGCAARLERVKGVDRLIDALACLPSHIHIAIAGNGSEGPRLQAQAAQLGLTGRVHFLGAVNDMPRFYQSLDLFCLVSRAEGLPLSLLEAQACGIRSIASDVGAMAEGLCPRTGRIARDVDARGLAVALVSMLGEPSLATPRDFVVTRYDLGGVAAAYDQLYATVAG
jgi:glycosyltransferase involved in cell wall biosynthesis